MVSETEKYKASNSRLKSDLCTWVPLYLCRVGNFGQSLCVCVMLGIEPKTLSMLDYLSTTELNIHSQYILFFRHFYLCTCVCVNVCHVYADISGGQKKTSAPLELEL